MINSTQFLRHNSADSSETVRQGQVSRAAEENDKDVFSPASSSSSGLTEARLGRCLGPVKETSLPLITASHTKAKESPSSRGQCWMSKCKLEGLLYLQVMKVLQSDMESSKECLLIPASNSSQIWWSSSPTGGWSAQLRGSQYQLDGGSKERR